MSWCYSLHCAFWLLSTLFLHFFNTTLYHAVDTFEYTRTGTQEVVPVAQVYITPQTKVMRPQYGTLTILCFSSMKSHVDKHPSIFIRWLPLSSPTPFIFYDVIFWIMKCSSYVVSNQFNAVYECALPNCQIHESFQNPKFSLYHIDTTLISVRIFSSFFTVTWYTVSMVLIYAYW